MIPCDEESAHVVGSRNVNVKLFVRKCSLSPVLSSRQLVIFTRRGGVSVQDLFRVGNSGIAPNFARLSFAAAYLVFGHIAKWAGPMHSGLHVFRKDWVFGVLPPHVQFSRCLILVDPRV